MKINVWCLVVDHSESEMVSIFRHTGHGAGSSHVLSIKMKLKMQKNCYERPYLLSVYALWLWLCGTDSFMAFATLL